MLLYNLVIYAYGLVIKIASLKKLKAKQWVDGRKNWKQTLSSKIATIEKEKKVWVHCASYGEFEQGRPLIEAIKIQHPEYKIVLSFFSPSGYEAFKDWKTADVVCYLPLDTKSNAKAFLNIVKPVTSIFIKYEFWVNFLFQLKKQNSPAYLVSATFKNHHPFFKWYGGLFRKSLQTFKILFLQDHNSAKLMESIGLKNYEVMGDTRFDRVLEIKNSFKPLDYFETFCTNKQVIVGGSTWPKDEELLIEAYKKLNNSDLKLILVPHQVDKKSIVSLEELLKEHKLEYTLYGEKNTESIKNILVVDVMGLLSRIYHYASVAYIGGGFNSGIHNCLEASVYLKPIMFYGNDYHKYNEAIDLIKLNAAKNILSAEELTIQLTSLLGSQKVLKELEVTLQTYFNENSGTTQKVLSSIGL